MNDFYAQLERQLVDAGRLRNERSRMPRALAGRGRPLAGAGALIAAVAIAAAVVVSVAPGQRDAVQRSPAAPSAPAPSVANDLRGIRVAVLNGTTQTGLARVVAAQVESLGARVVGVGNAPRQNVAVTVVRHRHGARAKALRVAAALGVARVGPVRGSLPNAGRAEVIVLVGADRQGRPKLVSPPRPPARPPARPGAPQAATP
jgi:hypothetical protein